MTSSKKQVISMLVGGEKITLFTNIGELIEIKNDGDYDTTKIAEFLTPKLKGTNAVEIDLTEYSRVAQVIAPDLEEHGIEIIQIIDGKEVHGIFYPRKVAVAVAVEVTPGKTEKVVIPDVENLSGHMQRASEENSPSVANFLKRLAPVLHSRRHSGEDLMKFIKLSEMPLTNDGRIIAYKRVQNHSEKDYFVDCHTKLVKQRVGSRVQMQVDLVDPSRHNSCSVGLHVANLGYMKDFSGSHTLIVLVNPEDFIAVPKGEDTKARVCGYEIIGVMSGNAHDKVNTGSHVSGDTNLQQLIKGAVEGNHAPVIEIVQVGDRGQVLSTTSVNAPAKAPVVPVATSSGKSLNEDAKRPEEERSKETVKTVRTLQGVAQATIPDEVKAAFKLLKTGMSKAEVCRKVNTSSRTLGRWIEKYGDPLTLVTPVPDETNEVGQEALEATAEAAPEIIKNLAQPTGAPNIKEQARKLYNTAKIKADMDALILFKKIKKKSWESLGFTEAEIGQIKKAME